MALPFRMNRNAWILLGVLGLVLLWTRAMDQKTKAFRARAAAQRAAAAAPGASAGLPGAASLSAPAGARQVPAASLASLRVAPWGEDPFFKSDSRASGEPAADAPARSRRPLLPSGAGLQLHGILWAGGAEASSAQICDVVARKGESVHGWTLTDIQPGSVTLRNKGVTKTLTLHEDEP